MANKKSNFKGINTTDTMNKVLIIDDDLDMCRLLDRFLTRNNFDVKIAHTGKKGMEEIEKLIPDVVLCDFRLEDTDGRDLLVQIKAISQQIPVIIITGYSDIKIAVDVIKYGAYDYITKPLFPEEILLTIKKAISYAQGVANETSQPVEEKIGILQQSPGKKQHAGLKYIFSDFKY